MNTFLRTMLYGTHEKRGAEQVEERAIQGVSDLGVAFASVYEAIEALNDYSIPSVYRGAQILADTVGSLPLQLIDDKTKKVKKFQPRLLTDPDPSETYHDTLSSIMYSLIFTGNAFLHPVTRTERGEVTSLFVMDPAEVTVEWDKRKLYRLYSWRDQDLAVDEEIVHIAINRYPGALMGVGPFTAARLSLNGIKAENNYAKKLFEDEATPSMAINVPQPLTKDEASVLLAQWEESHKNRKRPAIMSGGSTIEQISLNPIDAEFLESRKFSVQEIARMLGLPSSYLNAESDASLTYSTVETQNRMFLTATLNPTYLEKIGGAFSRMLSLGEAAQFDVSALLRADQGSRFEAHAVALAAGFMTVNEVRAVEGLEPVDGGDEAPEPKADGPSV